MAIIIRNDGRVRMPVMKHFFQRFFILAVAALLMLVMTGCHQRVVLTPGEDDLVVLNGCVVSACNYLAVVKTQHALDKNFWAKILLVRVYGYDRNSGAFPIPVYTRDPRAIAIVLAQELSRILNEPMAVSRAEFVNASEAELYTFSSLQQSMPASPMAAFVQVPSLTKP
jgi:hypothetical protein